MATPWPRILLGAPDSSVTTLKRDELIYEGRGKEIEKLVMAVRELQNSLQEGGSE
ncbi:MAG: hypothetical protein OXC09_05340 [Truepera sp.]|nr:hypothetical protein [Truepera sp.]